MFGDEKYYYQMVKSGVKGFLLKSSGINELINAISEVHGGKTYFSNELLIKLVETLSTQKEKEKAVKQEIENLSKRELEVLRLIALGYSNEETAEKLHIGVNTVRTHRANLIDKTGCNNTASLVMFAIKNKLVEISN